MLVPGIQVNDHKGLRLDLPLAEVGPDQAIDLLDVDWHSGVLGSREGAKAFSAEEGAANYDRLFAYSFGARATAILLARRGGTLVYFDGSTGKEVSEGEAEALSIAVAEKHLSVATMGINEGGGFIPVAYIADQEHALRRFGGNEPGKAGFTSPSATVDGEAGKAMPIGSYLAVWPDGGNRLVIAGTTNNGGPGGATSDASYVWFSDAADPEAYTSTSYVAVSPGEDEDITACCVWGGQVFVFKETKLAVFYSVTADEEGNPIFNFREVDLGTRITSKRENKLVNRVAVGKDGVYFISQDGLFVTTGGEPVLLSGALSPLADTTPLQGPAAETLPAETARWEFAYDIAYSQGEVYVVLNSSRLLRYDTETGRWTVWKANLNNIVAWVEEPEAKLDLPRIFFSRKEGAKKVYFYTPEEEDDPTVEMEPRWQSGLYTVGDDVDEATLTQAKMWGTGEVTMKVAEDYGALGHAKTFKLGEEGAIAQRQDQLGQTATLFSHGFSGAAPWSVQRFARYVRETRVPATQKAS